MKISINPVYSFLSDIKDNNNRDWFQANKSNYESAHQTMIDFAETLLEEMKQFDHISTISGKKSLYRIYRDVRFSKNKLPYKTSWSGSFQRATKSLRGGYYYHIEPGNTFIAGGFFGPNPDDLRLIRSHIDAYDDALRDVLNTTDIQSYFGGLIGELVKTAPKRYAKDHPAIDLLRYKQFILKHHFSDQQVFSHDFYKTMAYGFQKLLPFFEVMSEILTTDLNGNSLI